MQYFLHAIGIFPNIPTEQNVAHWDADWYHSIVKNGYTYSNAPSNSGFFILLPWIWKLFHLNAWGVCIVNTVFLASGITLLSELFSLKTIDKLLWLSIPTVYFAFVPYTEALFFFLISSFLYGVVKNKKAIIWIALFFANLTRASAVFLIPGFLIMALLTNDRSQWYKSVVRCTIDYILPSLAGLAVFILYQYWTTGVWFAYFKQQTIYWERKFTMPAFPLSSMDGNRLIWLDALAIFVCFVSFLLLVKYSYKWLIKNRIQSDKLLMLSYGYLVMAAISIIFFNPKWGTLTTNVTGAQRYALMNPFFYVFLYHYTNRVTYNWKGYATIFIIANIAWLLFGSYIHIQCFLFFTTDTVIVLMYMAYSNKKIEWPGLILIAINIFLQIHLFQQFIK